MNKIIRIHFLALSLSVAMPAAASDLTIPNSFTAGTSAVAAEVNANFTAVETAVDDNDSRITTLEGTMPGKVDLSGDTMTGDLTVPRIAYSSARTHYVSISGDAFRPRTNLVDYSCGTGNGGCRINVTSSIERLIATANLPHGARITAFTVHIYDNDASNDLDAWLALQMFTSGYYPLGTTVTTTGASTTTQALTSTLSSSQLVNNTSTGIVLSIGPASGSSWTASSSLLQIRGATITYTISEAD